MWQLLNTENGANLHFKFTAENFVIPTKELFLSSHQKYKHRYLQNQQNLITRVSGNCLHQFWYSKAEVCQRACSITHKVRMPWTMSCICIQIVLLGEKVVRCIFSFSVLSISSVFCTHLMQVKLKIWELKGHNYATSQLLSFHFASTT